MKYIVLLNRNETYEQYCNSIFFIRPHVCICKDWGGTTIYYEEEIIK